MHRIVSSPSFDLLTNRFLLIFIGFRRTNPTLVRDWRINQNAIYCWRAMFWFRVRPRFGRNLLVQGRPFLLVLDWRINSRLSPMALIFWFSAWEVLTLEPMNWESSSKTCSSKEVGSQAVGLDCGSWRLRCWSNSILQMLGESSVKLSQWLSVSSERFGKTSDKSVVSPIHIITIKTLKFGTLSMKGGKKNSLAEKDGEF